MSAKNVSLSDRMLDLQGAIRELQIVAATVLKGDGECTPALVKSFEDLLFVTGSDLCWVALDVLALQQELSDTRRALNKNLAQSNETLLQAARLLERLRPAAPPPVHIAPTVQIARGFLGREVDLSDLLVRPAPAPAASEVAEVIEFPNALARAIYRQGRTPGGEGGAS